MEEQEAAALPQLTLCSPLCGWHSRLYSGSLRSCFQCLMNSLGRVTRNSFVSAKQNLTNAQSLTEVLPLIFRQERKFITEVTRPL
jgi:hypothetical protein